MDRPLRSNGDVPGKKDQKTPPPEGHIDALNERLYRRGAALSGTARTKLSPRRRVAVADRWEVPKREAPQAPAVAPPPKAAGRREWHTMLRSYRVRIMLGALLFFMGAVLVSAAFLFFGNNSISGKNIAIDIDGPFAIPGGSELSLGLSIANNNAVPIESAVLIVEWPAGTQTTGENSEEIFSERRQLSVIEPGEVHNVPLRARVFGEENAERIVRASVEYRVRGSNATFYKEAEPFRVKVSASPVVVDVDTVRSLSSGQPLEVTLTVRSNTTEPLKNVLVRAEYPLGFEFFSAEPAPVSGNDTWLITELQPEEAVIFTLSGTLSGKQDEEKLLTFTTGIASPRDRFALTSLFTTNTAPITIEAPFLAVGVEVGRSTDRVVAIERGAPINVQVSLTNTLSDTLYDGSIEVAFTGNALSDTDVSTTFGYYDSVRNMLTFSSADISQLREIEPGVDRSFSFTLELREDVLTTPELGMRVTARGKRVFEDRVPQELVATVERTLRVESVPVVGSVALFAEGEFQNTGPMPPVAETQTTYTLRLAIDNGSNDLTGTAVTATLPQYVTWTGSASPEGAVSFNSTTRVLTWDVGSLAANASKTVAVQVAVRPSVTQINRSPTILGTQMLRATDRFTGTTVRAEAPALTTTLHGERDSGRVQAN